MTSVRGDPYFDPREVFFFWNGRVGIDPAGSHTVQEELILGDTRGTQAKHHGETSNYKFRLPDQVTLQVLTEGMIVVCNAGCRDLSDWFSSHQKSKGSSGC